MAIRPIKRRSTPLQSSQLPHHLHPVLRRVYVQRGVLSTEQLEVSLSALISADQLGGIKAAVVLLKRALENQSRILVIGDFDADGATSTALALRALRAMGASDVHYLVPNRFEYGYGLTPQIVEIAALRQPDLIITVDNGVASIDGVKLAHSYGIKVMITDHHLPGPQLPEADVIINPNLKDDPFPSKALAGVGVIFYVMLSLRAHLRNQGWFEANHIIEPNMAQFLDLVALGTVADMVPLDHNNRILVEQGLRRIRAGRCVAGISALMRLAGRDTRRAVASDLSFTVGPRLNAAGRLLDMSQGIECLLVDNPKRALEIAKELDQLNRQRREIETQMQSEALEMLAQASQELEGSNLPNGLCLYDRNWHEGVIGILASRIKERFHRPVVVFADSGAGDVKGSARSIPGLHMKDLLEKISNEHPGMMSKFGGHAMAAGLSLPLDKLTQFREAYEQATQGVLSKEQLNGELFSDGELNMADFSLELAELIRRAGPWGQGFPEPEFDGVFEVISQRVVAGRHLKLLLKVHGTSNVDAIVFNIDAYNWHEKLDRVRILYRLDVNEYQNDLRPQLVVTWLQPVAV